MAKQRSFPLTMINFWLDAFLLVQFLAATWLAFMLRFLFPAPTTADSWSLWGYSYDQWSDAHFVIQCMFAASILVHVMLHWNWICGIITRRLLPRLTGKKTTWDNGTQTLIGVGLLIVLLNVLGVLFAAAAVTIQSPS